MVLCAVRRANAALLVICPPLLLAAAIPGLGLCLLGYLAFMHARELSFVLLAFFVFSAFFLGIAAYAFARAAWAQTVRCERRGPVIHVRTRESVVFADANSIALSVDKHSGLRPPPQYVVSILTPNWPRKFELHRGFSRWGAERAARRIREHLGVASATVSPDEER